LVLFKVGSFEVGSFEVGSFEVESFEVESFKVESFEVGSFEVGSFEVGSFKVQSVNPILIPVSKRVIDFCLSESGPVFVDYAKTRVLRHPERYMYSYVLSVLTVCRTS
jgi:hypothetical protein